ncbi:DNA translocase SpoIIIE [Alicyclobacillus hesperidum]|uniref:DNA translocase FtsK n=1 Tax=Alicyclobacillus hesperidum TaxID=89784 RepID=A0A1H2SKS9_9BACL|nr:DNA translocase SpoIIIE [Alicyclobacillus hesperidum]SDW32065.1 DNA translocase FtsK [Alicyclobacillus hesperidum]
MGFVARKQQQKNVLKYEVTGLAMLTGCALALGRLGYVGQFLAAVSIYLAGSWYFLIPILVGYAAIYMMVRRSRFVWDSRHLGLLILLLCILALIEMNFYSNLADQGLQNHFLASEWTALQELRGYIFAPTTGTPPSAGGGLVGFFIFYLLHMLFNSPQTYEIGPRLVIVAGGLIGIALVLQISLVSAIGKGSRFTERALDGLWKTVKRQTGAVFQAEKDEQPEIEEEAPRRRRRPTIVIDGEVYETHAGATEPVSATADAGERDVPPPVIHDFAARARQHAMDMMTAPHQEAFDDGQDALVETADKGLVVRFPDAVTAPKKPISPPTREHSAMPEYEVGPMVHDDNYQLPPLTLFDMPTAPPSGFSSASAHENAQKLQATLQSFGVQATVVEINRGPTVTRYELQPAAGVKVSRIVGLTDDIALALAARDIRMEAPVPGKSVIGIEVPNDEVAIVSLREVLQSPEFQKSSAKLALALGRDITGAPIVGDLQKMPHLLVAGATGSGKSVCINGMIASILMRAKPHEVKLLMIDPKMVELSGYNGIPHLLAPVVIDPRKAAFALKKVVQEMENRYQLMAERGARDIERYNHLLREEGLDPLPYIVVIVDELADLMMVAPGDVEDAICRIAQMARAAGIHLIVATQRPSVDVITGLIKANIPSRIAFAVSSMADSRTILDGGGAEKLLGRGDMLYLPVGAAKATRVQGAFVSELEIERLVEYVKNQQQAVYTVDLNTGAEESEPSEDGPELDSLFMDAVDLVVDLGQASVSMLQRRFRIGYSRAARIVDQMEQSGIVGPFEGSKPREVLISKEQWLQAKASFTRPQEG